MSGDMLLSVAGPNRPTKLRLPSQPNGITIPTKVNPSQIPVTMRRKVFIVNDHMAVGAAGTAIHIAAFLDDLKNRFHGRDRFTKAEIWSFLEKYPSSSRGQEIFEQVAFLIVVEAEDWRGSLTRGLDYKNNFVTQRFGRVVTIGTGSSSIAKQVCSLDNQYKSGATQPPDGNVLFPEFGSLALNLSLLANIYCREFTSPSNIFEAWGGAYDLIYQNSDKAFQYLNDYTIFLRLFDGDQAKKGIQLMNVLKYQRLPDASYVAMINDGKLDLFGAKDITASNAPVTVTVAQGDFTMNSKVHISVIAVGRGERYMSPMIQVDGLDPKGEPHQTVFTDFDDDGRLTVFCRSDYDACLKEQAMSLLRGTV